MSYPGGGQPYPGQPYPGQPYPGQPYPGQPYPPAGAPPRLRGGTPLKLAIAFGSIGVIAVIVAAAVGFGTGLRKVDSFQRVPLSPGIGSVHFAAGNYVAYYEAPNYNTNGHTVPVVIVQLRRGQAGPLVRRSLYGGQSDRKVKSLTYDYHGHHGAALYQFTIKRAGTYRVALQAAPASNASPQADIAFGTSIAGGLAAGGILGGLGLLAILVALVLLVIGLVQRNRSRRVAAQSGYGGGRPPGYGGGPPPGYGGGPSPGYPYPPPTWQPPQQ
jgi:hypothetical protein